MSWCVLSAVVAGLVTLGSYFQHGYLGLMRDTDFELETTARFGVTLGDLAFVGLFVLIQLTTMIVLIACQRQRLPNRPLQPTSGSVVGS
jgi:hypothetical protein